MKKNDGYVIIYVVFVIIFLCIVAVGTCTSALNNLKTQHAVVEQMQDRYTAEGNIEQFMAEVCIAGEAISSTGKGVDGNVYIYETTEVAAASAKADFVRSINQKLASALGETVSGTGGDWENSTEYTVTLETVSGSTKISATVAFSVSIETSIVYTENVKVDEKDTEKHYFGYRISNVTSQYISYRLESAGGES